MYNIFNYNKSVKYSFSIPKFNKRFYSGWKKEYLCVRQNTSVDIFNAANQSALTQGAHLSLTLPAQNTTAIGDGSALDYTETKAFFTCTTAYKEITCVSLPSWTNVTPASMTGDRGISSIKCSKNANLLSAGSTGGGGYSKYVFYSDTLLYANRVSDGTNYYDLTFGLSSDGVTNIYQSANISNSACSKYTFTEGNHSVANSGSYLYTLQYVPVAYAGWPSYTSEINPDDSKVVVLGSRTGQSYAGVFNTSNMSRSKNLGMVTTGVGYGCDWSSDGRYIALATTTGVRVFDVFNNYADVTLYDNFETACTSVRFSPLNQFLAVSLTVSPYVVLFDTIKWKRMLLKKETVSSRCRLFWFKGTDLDAITTI